MSEQDLQHIIKQLSKRMFKNVIVSVISAVVIAVAGMLIRDHFVLDQKMDREEYYKNYYNLLMTVESKTRAIESLAKTNAEKCIQGEKTDDEIKSIVARLEAYQRDLDKELRAFNRVRGPQLNLPEY